MIYFIDLDGVVVNIMQNWLDQYNRDWEDDLTTERITAWETHSFAKGGTRIYDYMWREGFFGEAPPYPGAIEAIQCLWNLNHTIYFASTPIPSAFCPKEKYDWVEHYLPEIGRENVILGWNKGLLRGDALVDDKPENLLKFKGMKVLMDRPWNRDCAQEDNARGIFRAMSWDDVVYFLR